MKSQDSKVEDIVNNSHNIDSLLADMDAIFKLFLFARSLTPFIPEQKWINAETKDLNLIETAPLYQSYGFDASIYLRDSSMQYSDWLSTGDWINRSFFVRIYAILDSLGLVKYMDSILLNTADRERCVWDLHKNLRHVLVHSTKYTKILKNQTKGNYRDALRLQKKLYPLLCETSDGINLDVAKFIIPFYAEFRDVLINHLSEFDSFSCDKNGNFQGIINLKS